MWRYPVKATNTALPSENNPKKVFFEGSLFALDKFEVLGIIDHARHTQRIVKIESQLADWWPRGASKLQVQHFSVAQNFMLPIYHTISKREVTLSRNILHYENKPIQIY